MEEQHIPYSKIVDLLEINPGDVLFVTSDISRLAFHTIRAEGGFDSNLFIDSLQQKLGSEGTLLFPAYNFLLESGDKFDIKKSKPFLCGALSMAAWQRPDFRRTKHPLHSFLVWGKYCGQLCAMENKSSFGDDSPFAFMHRHKAKMLCIDIDLWGSFTFIHYIEQMENVGYRFRKKILIDYTAESGAASTNEYYVFKKFPGIEMVFHRMEKIMKNHGVFTDVCINNSLFRIIPLDDNTFSFFINDIRNNKGRSIARFNFVYFLKDIARPVLKKLSFFKPLNEKISHASGI